MYVSLTFSLEVLVFRHGVDSHWALSRIRSTCFELALCPQLTCAFTTARYAALGSGYGGAPRSALRRRVRRGTAH